MNDAEAALREETRELGGVTAGLVMAGTGIGAAFMAGGRMIRGARGWAGELGYLPVVKDGTAMTLDQVASGAALVACLGVEGAVIRERLEAGGVVFTTVQMIGSYSSHRLWATMGADFSTSSTDVADNYRWDPGNTVFTTPYTAPDMTGMTNYKLLGVCQKPGTQRDYCWTVAGNTAPPVGDLAGDQAEEVDREAGRIKVSLAWTPDEPLRQDIFDAWVYQSINRTIIQRLALKREKASACFSRSRTTSSGEGI